MGGLTAVILYGRWHLSLLNSNLYDVIQMAMTLCHSVDIYIAAHSASGSCMSSSVVGQSVGNERVFWKNGRLDRDSVWGGGSGGSREPCISWWSGKFLAEMGRRNATHRENVASNVQKRLNRSSCRLGLLLR